MKSSGLSNKLLILLAAVGIGYLGTSVYFHFFPPPEPAMVAHTSRHTIEPDPETILAQSSAGVDLPPEVRRMMLGQPAKDPRHTDETRLPSTQTNYAFVIGEHLQEQVLDMRERLLSSDGSKQENGETLETLEAQAREGRMSW